MTELPYKAFLVRITLAIAMLCCLLILTIRIQQYAFRFRAERLQQDVRRLAHGKATLEEAQEVFRRWGATYDDGSCTAKKCFAQISFDDFAYVHRVFLERNRRLFSVYAMLGGRPSRVRAAVSIQEGFVRHKDYTAFVEVFPKESKPSWSTPYSYTLIPEVATVESLPPGLAARSPHPAYWIGSPGGCEVCILSVLRLTPAASPDDVQRLSQIDFSCVSRWLAPCRYKEDIMPAAWAEVRREED